VTFQRCRGAGEQRGALAREELVEEHLADEVVAETEAVGVLDEEAFAAQLVDCRLVVRRVEPSRRLEDARVDRCGKGGRRLDAADGVGAESLAAGEHDMAHALGEAVAGKARSEDLLDVERVATGTP
jgi:hypothetical protein